MARSGIDYYIDVQSAALPAFISPSVTVRFRQAVRETGLGPRTETAPLADYLAAEQRLGRVRADVDPEASARLLLAGCFHRAYIEMFLGADAGPSREASAREIIRELRLEPFPSAPAVA
ncbi:MAG TPA: TetR/AcrR family transcriptional regulator C-terminal domain-containing protein [Nonomuraea sp.]|nr:TetR/AcrR family transcriptional regulator C-terminal domain-containing protein [Nonomuraea sp.]